MRAILLIAGMILIAANASADTLSGTITSMDPNDGSVTVSSGGRDVKVTLKDYLGKGGKADFLDIGLTVEVAGKPNPAGGFIASSIKKTAQPQEEPMPAASEVHRVKFADDPKIQAEHGSDLSEIVPAK